MSLIKFFIFTLSVNFCVNSAFALDIKENHTLTLTIINHTDKTLSYVGVKNTNPGNTFHITPTEILPGGAATVIATTNPYYDLTGQLRFRDNSGFVSLLKINNYRHINFKQPNFAIENENYTSFTDTKKFNRNDNATALMSSAATVVIENKL